MASSPPAICFITQFNKLAHGGLSRYEQSLYPHLKKKVGARLAIMEPWPVPKPFAAFARTFRRDLNAIARNYPCRIPDSCQAQLAHFSHQTLALSLLFQKPERVVVTVHDLIPYIEMKRTKPDRREMTGFWEKSLYLAALHALRKAHHLIVDSEQTKQDLIQYLHIAGSSITVVPLGVDRQIFKPAPVPPSFYQRMGLNPSDQYLLYVGSQEARKNLPLLFRAFCRIRSRRPGVRLLIAGTPRSSFSEANASLLQELGISQWVHFLGFVTESELVYLYNLSHALVMPSFYEGFGLPVLEAMACGCPVISSNATSLAEVTGTAGTLVSPSDENAWVEAMDEVLANPSLRRRLTEAGFDRASGFSWEATAEATAAVYRRLMR